MNPRNQRHMTIAALGVALALLPTRSQAEQWVEIRSAHFVVTSNAGQSTTRTLVWQLEQGLRRKAYDEALKESEAALALARTGEERLEAQALIASIRASKSKE